MKPTCPFCGDPLPPVQTDEASSTVKCPACDATVSFHDDADAEAAQARSVSLANDFRDELSRPRGVQVEEREESVRFIRRWFNPAAFLGLILTVGWSMFLYDSGSDLLHADPSASVLASPEAGGVRTAMFPVAALFFAGAAALAYSTLTMFVNRTIIDVSDTELAVRHGPLPWPGGHTLCASDLTQLYCRKRMRMTGRGRRLTYELVAIMKNGSLSKLVKSARDPDQLRYLERHIEDRLHITDRPVGGELFK